MSNRETNKINIKDIITQLINSGTKELTYGVINNLRKLFENEENKDHIISSIVDNFQERQKKIDKTASKILRDFEGKYGSYTPNMSYSRFIHTLNKYKKKNKLSEEIFTEVKNKFDKRVYQLDPIKSKVFSHTNMSNVFGYPTTMDVYENPFNINNTEDFAYLQEILKTHEVFKNLHQYVMIQTVMYNLGADGQLPTEISYQKYDKNRHQQHEHVHPVIVALFFFKNKELEKRMLYSSFSNIVTLKYNKLLINTKPDYELLYEIITDPSDLVCDMTSPIKDLKNRMDIQLQLWQNVYNLRNGNCYRSTAQDFLTHIDKCRINSFDNPDVLFLSDEGNILKKLLSVFSFRPIMIQKFPVLNSFSVNPLNLYANYVEFTRIPYIVYQIPIGYNNDITSVPTNPFMAIKEPNIKDFEDSIQLYYQDGILVPKRTIIAAVTGLLIYYIPRKYKKITSITEYNYYEKNLLDNNIAFNAINYNKVKFPPKVVLKHNDKKIYKIKSLVYYNMLNANLNSNSNSNSNVLIGHKTLLFNDINSSDGEFDTTVNVQLYQPICKDGEYPFNQNIHDTCTTLPCIDEDDFCKGLSEFKSINNTPVHFKSGMVDPGAINDFVEKIPKSSENEENIPTLVTILVYYNEDC